ncbi:predicted protein [Nematostella vectensis]|uniref:G-protein coupled receptors family 1 profile domain-containing protein n=1 Tax=Nematostella vectensis TaxID=45351 RepID=A7RKI0_NEMVE|nr:predicted protein [Nematostella vectensis]|eukprot:XP_001639976.1 predicted protein [Nematostella vectensis]
MTSDILADAALAALFAVLVAVDIIGNAFVCFVILKHRVGVTLIHTRTAMDYLLANLAASDILLGVFVIPRYIIPGSVNPMGFKGDLLCKFVTGGVFIWVGGAASVFSLILIAAERYSSVVYPHKPNLRISKARLPDVLLSCWIFAFILNSPLFIFMVYDEKSEFCVEEWPSYVLPRAYGILWLLYGGLVPIAAMACLYAQIIRSLWFKHPSLTINTRSNVPKVLATPKPVPKMRRTNVDELASSDITVGLAWGRQVSGTQEPKIRQTNVDELASGDVTVGLAWGRQVSGTQEPKIRQTNVDELASGDVTVGLAWGRQVSGTQEPKIRRTNVDELASDDVKVGLAWGRQVSGTQEPKIRRTNVDELASGDVKVGLAWGRQVSGTQEPKIRRTNVDELASGDVKVGLAWGRQVSGTQEPKIRRTNVDELASDDVKVGLAWGRQVSGTQEPKIRRTNVDELASGDVKVGLAWGRQVSGTQGNVSVDCFGRA